MTVRASRAAQPAIPADRFAREIVRFLVSACAARSRQLNGNPLACTIKRDIIFGHRFV